MTDWADEMADELSEPMEPVCLGDWSPVDVKAIAAALRKAKATGMREAAEIASKLEDDWASEWRRGLKGDTHLEGKADGADVIWTTILATASKLSPT